MATLMQKVPFYNRQLSWAKTANNGRGVQILILEQVGDFPVISSRSSKIRKLEQENNENFLEEKLLISPQNSTETIVAFQRNQLRNTHLRLRGLPNDACVMKLPVYPEATVALPGLMT
jgi:hypothetical protein